LAKKNGFSVSSDNKITVVIETKNISSLLKIESSVKRLKGKILSKYKNLIKVKVNIKTLAELNKEKDIKK